MATPPTLPASAPAGPIFLIGPMGSGTTLLRLILDSHENIAIAQETGFARSMLAAEWVPYYQFGGEWYQRIGLRLDDVDRDLGELYGRWFTQYAATKGATRWGDKTPFHAWHVPLLARAFPDAVFVATMRHPAAVALSVHRRMGYPWPQSVRHWVRVTKRILGDGAELGERFLLCRYEDLVADPEPLLRDLLARLGEPWSDRLLDFHEVHADRGTPTEVEGHTRSDRPIDPSRAGAWISRLTADRRAELQRPRIRRLSRLLGYDLERPAPTGPLRPGDGGHVIDGDDVARLVAAHPELSWDQPPRPSRVNRPLRLEDLRRLRRAARGHRHGRWSRLGERASGWARAAGRRLPPNARDAVRSVLQTRRR